MTVSSVPGVAFTVPAGALHAACDWAARACPSKAVVPILQGILIEAHDDRVTMSGFDYDRHASVTVDALVSEPGRVLLPGRLLASVAGVAAKGSDVVVESTGGSVRVVAGRARWSIPVLPVEDYPKLSLMPQQVGSVRPEVFAEAVGQVAVAAGRDDTLPMLTGIRLEIDGAKLTMAATDRFRLAVRELEWEPGDMGLSTAVLVPAKTLADATKTLAGGDIVQLALADKDGMLGLLCGNRQLTTRLLDSEFPKYRSLLPSNHTSEAVVQVGAFTEAVKRVSLVAERSAQVKLEFGDDTLRLVAGDDDGNNAEEQIPRTLEGDPLSIAFNPHYLLDMLSVMRTEQVHLGFTAPNRPALARPVGTGDYQHLLMPVRIPG